MNKKFFSYFVFTFLFSFVFSQEKLTNFNTSWSNVIPGTVITSPALTSYGFCLGTDGRTISAFSGDGKLLWEKQVKTSKDFEITSLPGDFLLIWDNKYKSIKLLNPSGMELWTRKLSYSLTNRPFSGRDGRFFLTGENIVECYGINGIKKWSIKTDLQKNIGIKELEDGSLIIFLQKEIDGKSTALRISPFGKILEEIIFSGIVKDAYTGKEGVFLTFTDGVSGMFHVEKNLSVNKWVLNKKSSDSMFLSSDEEYLFLELFSDKVIVNKISPIKSDIVLSFTIENINGLNLQLALLNNNMIFLGDLENYYLYTTDGQKKWWGIIPEENSGAKISYVLFTNDNHFVICYKNWTVNGYLTCQELNKTVISKKTSYKEYYNINTYKFSNSFTSELDRNIIGDKRYIKLKKGNYGPNEIEYGSDLYSICTGYLEDLTKIKSKNSKSISVYQIDSYGVQGAFKQLGIIGTSDSCEYISKLINKVDNYTYLNVLLQSVANSGYDLNGNILKSIEIKLGKIDRNEKKVLKSVCDSVFAICNFMGRPAFNSQGKTILKKLMEPQYGSEINDYAIKTLGKIADLNL